MWLMGETGNHEILDPILAHTLGIEDLVPPNKTLLVNWDIPPNLCINSTKTDMKKRIQLLVSLMLWK